MKNNRIYVGLLLLLVISAGAVTGTLGARLRSLGAAPVFAASPLTAVGNGFTYQGQLTQGGSPAVGSFDLTFTLFDQSSGGSAVAAILSRAAQTVTDGRFTVELDFGPSAFTGNARWLEITVAPSGGIATILTPRQPLTPTPYALSSPWLGTSDKPTGYNPLRLANQLTTVSGATQSYASASVTIGADGLPLLTRYDPTAQDLYTVHCQDIACVASSESLIDSAGNVGYNASITLGADNLALIIYTEGGAATNELRAAHCQNLQCTNATISVVDTGDRRYVEAVIGSDGLALLAYRDATSQTLQVAHCTDLRCSAATITTIDNSANVSSYTSIMVGADGLGLITYYDVTNQNLKSAHCSNVSCTSASLATLDSIGNVGTYTHVVLGQDDRGLIGYRDETTNALKAAHCSNIACSSATVTTLDSSGIVGYYAATQIGSDGLGVIAHWDNTNNALKVAHCANITCTAVTSVVLDQPGPATGHPVQMGIGIDGLPLLVYTNSANQLKVAHCGSPLCVSYLHRR